MSSDKAAIESLHPICLSHIQYFWKVTSNIDLNDLNHAQSTKASVLGILEGMEYFSIELNSKEMKDELIFLSNLFYGKWNIAFDKYINNINKQ